MEISKNPMKIFNPEKVSYGIWNALPDTSVAEILANCSYDWMVIDGEHAPFDLKSIRLQLQSVAPYHIHPIVRIPNQDITIIKQVLDYGAQTIIVPMVETAEEALNMGKAMYYPPQGIRGVGAALARASRWNTIKNYTKNANREMCLIVQVESEKGIRNLTEILDVEFIDGVFIGPSDLAASMGYLGNPKHPEVKKVIGEALQKIRAHHKIAGVLALEKSISEEYQVHGANMIGIGIDALLLANSARELLRAFKSPK